MTVSVEEILLKDDGIFPNNQLPALLYKGVLDIPLLFPAAYVKKLFKNNGWTNSWDGGIFTYHHYHSNTHEVLGIYAGTTTVMLGGEKGRFIRLDKGDVLVIPAGVAHKNLKDESAVKCVGAYPGGRKYDMNYGKPGERLATDAQIAGVPLPLKDPVYGAVNGLPKLWNLNL